MSYMEEVIRYGFTEGTESYINLLKNGLYEYKTNSKNKVQNGG